MEGDVTIAQTEVRRGHLSGPAFVKEVRQMYDITMAGVELVKCVPVSQGGRVLKLDACVVGEACHG